MEILDCYHYEYTELILKLIFHVYYYGYNCIPFMRICFALEQHRFLVSHILNRHVEGSQIFIVSFHTSEK